MLVGTVPIDVFLRDFPHVLIRKKKNMHGRTAAVACGTAFATAATVKCVGAFRRAMRGCRTSKA